LDNPFTKGEIAEVSNFLGNDEHMEHYEQLDKAIIVSNLYLVLLVSRMYQGFIKIADFPPFLCVSRYIPCTFTAFKQMEYNYNHLFVRVVSWSAAFAEGFVDVLLVRFG